MKSGSSIIDDIIRENRQNITPETHVVLMGMRVLELRLGTLEKEIEEHYIDKYDFMKFKAEVEERCSQRRKAMQELFSSEIADEFASRDAGSREVRELEGINLRRKEISIKLLLGLMAVVNGLMLAAFKGLELLYKLGGSWGWF